MPFQPSGNLNFVCLRSRSIPVRFVRMNRARRYILRVTGDGGVRVTLPRWGSKTEAHSFAQREIGWIEKQFEKRRTHTIQPWTDGTTFMFRGELVAIQLDHTNKYVCFASEKIPFEINRLPELQSLIETRLEELAASELIARTMELARLHRAMVHRIVIRNQKTRWGSCSVKRTISLNWRLIQTPRFVSDYIILHELMHLREMNHSPRFWRHVGQVCPDYRLAERWLKLNRAQIR
jgi:predicted metal-dependent hydrolase